MITSTNDGIDLYYETHGAANKPALVLIHGLGSSGEDWEYQIDALKDQYFIVIADLRGHGRSGKPQSGYSMSRFATDVFTVLDSLNLQQAHVVGISMGGGVAFQMAVDQPQRLQSLTIVNSGPSMKFDDPKMKFKIFLRRLMARWLTPAKAAPRIAQGLFPDPAMGELRQRFIERMSNNDPKAYRLSLNAFADWCVMDKIGEIQIPSCVIAADQDYLPVSMRQQYVDKMPRAKLEVITGAHHAVPVECPAEFNRVLVNFLASVTA